jgi:hypothetical protein
LSLVPATDTVVARFCSQQVVHFTGIEQTSNGGATAVELVLVLLFYIISQDAIPRQGSEVLSAAKKPSAEERLHQANCCSYSGFF